MRTGIRVRAGRLVLGAGPVGRGLRGAVRARLRASVRTGLRASVRAGLRGAASVPLRRRVLDRLRVRVPGDRLLSLVSLPALLALSLLLR
ncbi:hypothetical protein I6J42_19110 [Streptomyces californicus]|uniref:Uncharacterized protein n=1 Tax=Streptomyces californicus TaxID=67351 RepID=A0ABD7D3T3_9ACTN|nr:MULTISPECIES: hypothetical protein [Streptomyces]QRV28399.1 hypothetical protein I6J39_14595 [Streptomyces californicus]QRV35929.1 hypothetical protein I6J42_19110 [Streptomyces californicus]QRV41797.1 hypothetical protein I6J41_14430 [Streptomyces californicus]QRV48562.1 hypothetical protein I6J43_14520 [Streptomyces californicus]